MVHLETRCPHCHQPMLQWANPQLVCWSGDYQYICFNDDCPYFVNGWEWMRQQFSVDVSYRYRLDPANGDCGPLAVWSSNALKNYIIPLKDSTHAPDRSER